MDKEKAISEFKKYEEMRLKMYDYFDNLISKDEKGVYDFKKAKDVDIKEVFEMFCKLDYQARKIRGIAVNCLDVKVE